jgi:hypothetical protein
MMTVIPAQGDKVYVCVANDRPLAPRNTFNRLRIIGWETTGDGVAIPVTIAGRVAAESWLLLDDDQFLIMPQGVRLDNATEAACWLRGEPIY